MAKCPCCGSSTQSKKISCTNTKKCLIERFKCSCDCQFDVFYYWCDNVIYMTDIKIVDKTPNLCYNKCVK